MRKEIILALIGISFISFISSSVYAGGSFSEPTGTTVPGPKGFTVETSSIIAGNYDVDGSTTTKPSSKKGRDGAACSSDDECEHVCEGGSCCTKDGDRCDSLSHCCGHPSQGCTNGKCPQ